MVQALDRQINRKLLFEMGTDRKVSSVQTSSLLAGLGSQNSEKKNQSGLDFDSYIRMNQTDQVDEKKQEAIMCANYGPFATAGKIDYFDMAEKGVIVYNGVTIACDEEHNALCIGDMGEDQDIFQVSLTGGKTLKVNRKNMDSIGKVIGMFSPEDQKLIVNAILVDKQVKKAQYDMDEQKLKVALTDSQK